MGAAELADEVGDQGGGLRARRPGQAEYDGAGGAAAAGSEGVPRRLNGRRLCRRRGCGGRRGQEVSVRGVSFLNMNRSNQIKQLSTKCHHLHRGCLEIKRRVQDDRLENTGG